MASRPASSRLWSGMPSRKRIDDARGRGTHLDARDHRGEVTDREIGALVSIARKLAAGIVAHAGPRIMVDIAGDPAVDAGLAVDRQQEIVGRTQPAPRRRARQEA